MTPVALLSWGYYGWGNRTRQFVHAVDAVVEYRGFVPPVFVDIRIPRSGRAYRAGVRTSCWSHTVPVDEKFGQPVQRDPDRDAHSDRRPKSDGDLLELTVTSAKHNWR